MKEGIPTRQIGKTGLKLHRIGYGCASLGNLYRPVTDETARDAVLAALDAGVCYFDTAPYYGFGLSERRVGDVLRRRARDSFVLSTKVGRLLKPCADVDESRERYGFCSPMPFEPVYDYSYSGIMRSYEDSLQRLGINRIDILYVHDIGELTHGPDNAHHFKTLLESGYRALDELRAAGEISAFGLGVNEYEVCEAAMAYGDYDCFLLAGRYTLLEQEALLSFLPACEKRSVSVIIGGAYNSGILALGTESGKPLYYNYEPAPQDIIDRVRAIEAVCKMYQVPLAAAALRFPLCHPTVASLIPGMGSPKRITQTLSLLNTPIPSVFWNTLIDQGLLRGDAPIPDEGGL